MKTLSIIQESEDIMNVEDISSAKELSILQLKKSENLMNFSKYVFYLNFFFFFDFQANVFLVLKLLKIYNFQDNSVGKHVNLKHLTEHFQLWSVRFEVQLLNNIQKLQDSTKKSSTLSMLLSSLIVC